MKPRTKRRLGRTALEVTQFGFGTVPIADPARASPEARAQATLAAAWKGGLRLYDTSPWYGNTKAEHRLGHFLRQKRRADYVLLTKVGRVYRRPADPDSFDFPRWAGGLPFEPRFDYTRDGILRSYEDSLQRLGINRVDGLAIHDLDLKHQLDEKGIAARFRELEKGGGLEALRDLRDRGEIGAVGAGINHTGMIPRFLERFDIDYFLVAMPYTLMDQAALDEELPLCQRHGAAVVIGAVFASGLLATGPRKGASYGYRPAERAALDKARAITAVCRRHDVSLKAAALQFPLAHPAVAAIIPGADAPAQVEQNLAAFRERIPADLWAELKAEKLLHPEAPTP